MIQVTHRIAWFDPDLNTVYLEELWQKHGGLIATADDVAAGQQIDYFFADLTRPLSLVCEALQETGIQLTPSREIILFSVQSQFSKKTKRPTKSNAYASASYSSSRKRQTRPSLSRSTSVQPKIAQLPNDLPLPLKDHLTTSELMSDKISDFYPSNSAKMTFHGLLPSQSFVIVDLEADDAAENLTCDDKLGTEALQSATPAVKLTSKSMLPTPADSNIKCKKRSNSEPVAATNATFVSKPRLGSPFEPSIGNARSSKDSLSIKRRLPAYPMPFRARTTAILDQTQSSDGFHLMSPPRGKRVKIESPPTSPFEFECGLYENSNEMLHANQMSPSMHRKNRAKKELQ